MPYLINTSADYADEFNYPVVSVMSDLQRQFLIDTYPIWSAGVDDDTEWYFGTNESIYLSANKILSLIESAEHLDDTKLATIYPYLAPASLDIIDRLAYSFDEISDDYQSFFFEPKEGIDPKVHFAELFI